MEKPLASDKLSNKKYEGGLRTLGYYKKSYSHKPLITVVTVVFNDFENIKETVESVINQNYDNIEYIVIDGSSNDGTIDVVRKYDEVIDYWFSEPDSGIYDAMNKGLKLASGDLIVFLNSGDYFYDNALEKVTADSLRYPEVGFFFAPVDKNGTRNRYKPWLIHLTFRFYTTHSVGFFIRRNTQKRVGLYNLKYKYSADYDLFYRLIVLHKIKGRKLTTHEPVGVFSPGGYSEQISIYDHLSEETKIRISNKQNRLVVLVIFVLRYLKNYTKLL